MLVTRSVIDRRFVRDAGGRVIGVEPVSVSQSMVYREGEMATPFAYDTAVHSEADVDAMLGRYPSFMSGLFRGMVSYFSKRIWRSRYDAR